MIVWKKLPRSIRYETPEWHLDVWPVAENGMRQFRYTVYDAANGSYAANGIEPTEDIACEMALRSVTRTSSRSASNRAGRDARGKPMSIQCKIAELHLADTVKLFDGPWAYGIVTRIVDGVATVFRPYGQTASFSYTGGVIPYVGFEMVELSVADMRNIEVIERKQLS